MRFALLAIAFSYLALFAWSAPVNQHHDTCNAKKVRELAHTLDMRELDARALPEKLVEIDGNIYHLRRHSNQGVHGVTYQVQCGSYKGAFAKTKVTSQEEHATYDVGALLFAGTDHKHRRWLFIKPSPGVAFDKTHAYLRVRHDAQACHHLLNHAADLATAAFEHYYTTTHWAHGDLTRGNILFDDHITSANLIDWDYADRPKNAPHPADIHSKVVRNLGHLCPPLRHH
ncbi:uncharacterized protein C8Q71DRAFT_854546 [Rhodofomes roseus]|uniref:Aminoglycoside phosphotransferase domain-containing protein n=1 Tax=Rhodofomes roseus TaxID=34475 RepID=A0ABQ8KQK0_9APHY|nr:uncharacterized protein C8Q71DRAFT_854546 [Rhodofomes roseus]KAH9840672.1 hypothetical protein C8Q71DRAFT_854546 [Rhodofomes roseus]